MFKKFCVQAQPADGDEVYSDGGVSGANVKVVAVV